MASLLLRLLGREPPSHAGLEVKRLPPPPGAWAPVGVGAADIGWAGAASRGGAPAPESFRRNPVVHRCVRLLAEAAAAVPLLAFVDGPDGAHERPDHPALALLAAPHPGRTGAALRETIVGHLLTSGNAYLEAVTIGARVRELHALRPERMRLLAGADGWAGAWAYRVGGRELRFPVAAEPPDLPIAPILHLALDDPFDDHFGHAPLEAAATAVRIHEACAAWNLALLENAARPSGALVYAGPGGANLTDGQFERLKSELEESFQGARNAGRPLLLEGGLDWKPLSLSPKDMDFIEAKAAAARDIALAFGVPPMMLGLPGDSTHANHAEAQRAFWRNAVVPLVARTAASLGAWLGPAFGPERLRLEPDLDRIEALSAEREALWARVGAADFLDANEKREAVGYGRREG